MSVLKEYRRAARLTQSQVAAQLGVSKASVSALESRASSGAVTVASMRRYREAVETLAPTSASRMIGEWQTGSSPAYSTRTRRRSLFLHHLVAQKIKEESRDSWEPLVSKNLDNLSQRIQGPTHKKSLARWKSLMLEAEITSLQDALTDETEEGCSLREVSPWSGLLSDQERQTIITLERSLYASH